MIYGTSWTAQEIEIVRSGIVRQMTLLDISDSLPDRTYMAVKQKYKLIKSGKPVRLRQEILWTPEKLAALKSAVAAGLSWVDIGAILSIHADSCSLKAHVQGMVQPVKVDAIKPPEYGRQKCTHCAQTYAVKLSQAKFMRFCSECRRRLTSNDHSYAI